MKKLILGLLILGLIFGLAGVTSAQPTIDGIIGTGEWDTHHLGTSTTGWGGGMIVDVYGYADDSYLYVAYEVDILNSPGFALALTLSFPWGNFIYGESQTDWSPDIADNILLERAGDEVKKNDGTGWGSSLGTPTSLDITVGIQGIPSANNGVAEFKVPLSLLSCVNGQICLSGQYWQYDWATPFCVDLPPIEVDIDIKPGSDPNSIKLKSKGVIPVAILGSDTFDVADVDVTTLVFAGASPAHDLTDPLVLADHLQNVNGDAYMDLVCHFRTQDTVISQGQTSAMLIGATLCGIPIFGDDTVRTVGK